jgi:hypothetical protein
LRCKKATLLILAVLLSLSTPAALSKTDTVSVDYVFEPVLMDNQCRQWMIEDTQTLEIPGGASNTIQSCQDSSSKWCRAERCQGEA